MKKEIKYILNCRKQQVTLYYKVLFMSEQNLHLGEKAGFEKMIKAVR